MTPLIDTIERAFIKGRESWRMDDAVDGRFILAELEVRGVHDDGAIEGALQDAYTASRRKWGNDWCWQTGDVAEEIVEQLRAIVTRP